MRKPRTEDETSQTDTYPPSASLLKVLSIALLPIGQQLCVLDTKYQSSYVRALSGAPDAAIEWHPEACTLMSWDHYANYSNLNQDVAVTVQGNQDPVLD